MSKEIRVLKVLLVVTAMKVHKDLLVPVLKVFKVLKDYKVYKVLQVLKE